MLKLNDIKRNDGSQYGWIDSKEYQKKAEQLTQNLGSIYNSNIDIACWDIADNGTKTNEWHSRWYEIFLDTYDDERIQADYVGIYIDGNNPIILTGYEAENFFKIIIDYWLSKKYLESEIEGFDPDTQSWVSLEHDQIADKEGELYKTEYDELCYSKYRIYHAKTRVYFEISVETMEYFVSSW